MCGCVLDRGECVELAGTSASLLVYGRRKVGKTWLVRNCVEWDGYFLVTRDGRCFGEGGLEPLEPGDCIKAVVGALGGGGTVVVDEFQRLRPEYLDLLGHKLSTSKGRALLLGSSLSIVEKVFAAHSPLLGLVEAYRVDLADPGDTLVSLAARCGLDAAEAAMWFGIARDPWILGLAEPGGDPVEVLVSRAERLTPAAPGLVGEVFSEERRALTRTYDAILRTLARGEWRLPVIAHRLHAAGLTPSGAPSHVTPYLSVLEKMGLVERVRLWRTRGARVYYRHRSTLLSLLYYMLDYVELGVKPGLEAVRSRYALELQFDLGELLARHKGLERAYMVSPEGWDVDVVLLDRRGRPVWGYEVKLGGITPSEARRAADRIRGAGIPRAGVVSLSEEPPEIREIDEALGPEHLLEMARKVKDNP